MATYYRTDSWSFDITPVDVTRETTHKVWLSDGHSANKVSESSRYHATEGDALAHLLERAERTRKRAKQALDEAERAIIKIRDRQLGLQLNIALEGGRASSAK